MNIQCKCGSTNYREEQRGVHVAAVCNDCNSYIKFIPKNPPQFYAGKHKGKLLSDVSDVGYLQWYFDNVKCSSTFKQALRERISFLNDGR